MGADASDSRQTQVSPWGSHTSWISQEYPATERSRANQHGCSLLSHYNAQLLLHVAWFNLSTDFTDEETKVRSYKPRDITPQLWSYLCFTGSFDVEFDVTGALWAYAATWQCRV